MENDFLPKDYKRPDTSDFMKFKDGENVFRVLTPAITGFEYWNKDSKPVRSREPFDGIPEDIKRNADGTPDPIKHFWAFGVWNYQANRVQVLEITQASIQDAVKALWDNPKWGSPVKYDISVTREGSGFDTTYTVMPNPHSELEPYIAEAFRAKKPNLEALYDGEYPFSNEKEK